MAKGRILAVHADRDAYDVEIDLGKTEQEALESKLTARIVESNEKLGEQYYQKTLKESAYNYFFQRYILRERQYADGLIEQETYDQAKQDWIEATAELELVEDKIAELKLNIKEAERERSSFAFEPKQDFREIRSVEPLDAIDQSKVWQVGDEVEVICLDAERDDVYIKHEDERMGYPRRYDSEVHGHYVSPLVQTAYQAYFNAALLPGVQKFKPTYRRAFIYEIDSANNTAIVGLVASRSKAQGLSILPTAERIEAQIFYAPCDASAFKVGDYVIVQFLGQDVNRPAVIGFSENPRACAPCKLYGDVWIDSFEEGSVGNIFRWGVPTKEIINLGLGFFQVVYDAPNILVADTGSAYYSWLKDTHFYLLIRNDFADRLFDPATVLTINGLNVPDDGNNLRNRRTVPPTVYQSGMNFSMYDDAFYWPPDHPYKFVGLGTRAILGSYRVTPNTRPKYQWIIDNSNNQTEIAQNQILADQYDAAAAVSLAQRPTTLDWISHFSGKHLHVIAEDADGKFLDFKITHPNHMESSESWKPETNTQDFANWFTNSPVYFGELEAWDDPENPLPLQPLTEDVMQSTFTNVAGPRLDLRTLNTMPYYGFNGLPSQPFQRMRVSGTIEAPENMRWVEAHPYPFNDSTTES